MLFIRFVFVSYIPYNVEIGPGVSFGHKIGIVINPSAKIGARVKIRHFVGIAGGPVTIGDDVEIGAGARLMGRITIGNGAKIGANACVVKDVPPNVTVVGVPARIVRWHTDARSTPEVAEG
ncbi:MAG: serine acetyltransferase [Rhodocyclaceae bacterium]|nr:serine acetyltransferase [Rhodocyclaceae bacterium]